jgi:transcriptional regulator with XRE-family HTH domain
MTALYRMAKKKPPRPTPPAPRLFPEPDAAQAEEPGEPTATGTFAPAGPPIHAGQPDDAPPAKRRRATSPRPRKPGVLPGTSLLADDPVVRAVLDSDESLSAIGRRFNLSKARIQQMYRELVESDHPVPERRPGRRKVRAGNPPERSGEPRTIGDRVAARRTALGLSQPELAELMEPPSNQTSIAATEHAGDSVTPDMVKRLAAALDCDPCDLDPRLVPANAVILARVDDGAPGVVSPRWEGLRAADRELLGVIWEGYGPASGELGGLVERAAEDGVAVVLRGDLPVRMEQGTGDEPG